MATKKKSSTKKKATTIETKLRSIEENRSKIYGPILDSHAAYGRAWASLLSSHFERRIPDLPAHVVAGMLAVMKVHRDVVPRAYNSDNNIDGMHYMSFMPRLDPRNTDSLEEETIQEDFG